MRNFSRFGMTPVSDISKRYFTVLMLTVALSALFAGCVFPSNVHASISGDYREAYRQFKSLVNDNSRGKYRSYWNDLETRFINVFKQSPKGSYAIKSLYYAGRVKEELGYRSFLRNDFRASVEYYQRAAASFPRHSWADDCLYRKAYIEFHKLGNPSQARKDLNTILRHYTRGDMYNKAVSLHREVMEADEKEERSSKPAKPEPQPSISKERESANVERSGDGGVQSGSGTVALREIRYQSSNEYTRVVLDLSDTTRYHYQILSADPATNKPFRLYVDLYDTKQSPKVDDELKVGDGILKRVRAGSPSAGVSRVVLDFNSVQKYHVFSLDNPFRVVIDVSAPKGGKIPSAPSSGSGTVASRKKASRAPKQWTPPEGSKKQVGDLVEQLGLTVQTIMIDAGHGGKDPGAMANGIREKDLVLKAALKVGNMLKRHGYTVLYTRDNNTFIPLEERTAMANVRKADLFISMHVNAHRSSSINGVETYYLNLARSKSAVRVAARENAVSEKRISDLQFILTDLMLNSKVQESQDLAELVQDNIMSITKKHRYSTRSNGVRSAPFYVLMGAKMPAVLVELGYCTNSAEAKRLKSDQYLDRLAEGITRGVNAYKQQLSRYASL